MTDPVQAAGGRSTELFRQGGHRQGSPIARRAARAGPNNEQRRALGALNALTRQVSYGGACIMGRERVGAFCRRLVATYPLARRIYAAQGNWSIHPHPDVLVAVERLPQVTPVGLPAYTYAPWLNPIEKLRQGVLTLHRRAAGRHAPHARAPSSTNAPRTRMTCCAMSASWATVA